MVVAGYSQWVLLTAPGPQGCKASSRRIFQVPRTPHQAPGQTNVRPRGPPSPAACRAGAGKGVAPAAGPRPRCWAPRGSAAAACTPSPAGSLRAPPPRWVAAERGRAARVPRRRERTAPEHLEEAGSADPSPGALGWWGGEGEGKGDDDPAGGTARPRPARLRRSLTWSSGNRRQRSSRGGASGAGKALRPRRRAEDARPHMRTVPACLGTYGEDGGWVGAIFGIQWFSLIVFGCSFLWPAPVWKYWMENK